MNVVPRDVSCKRARCIKVAAENQTNNTCNRSEIDCDMACHKKCEKLTGNLCGLNQKLVAEALQALKKGELFQLATSNNQRRKQEKNQTLHSSISF